MSTLNFDTAISAERAKKQKQKKMVVVLDGREMKVRFPSQSAVLLAQAAARRGDTLRFIDLILDTFGDEDRDWLMDRIEDPEDPLELADPEDPQGENGGVTLFVIFKRVMEEMSARPTSSSPASSRSSKSTGKSSTGGARVKAKRRSTSASAG